MENRQESKPVEPSAYVDTRCRNLELDLASTKPTALKRLAGNPGKRPLPTSEPQPTPGAPPCPTWMPPDGERLWALVVPELDRLGLLTTVDAAILEAYCSLYAEFAGGMRRREPVKTQIVAAMRMHGIELGLTPAARSKMCVPNGSSDDPAEEFFKPVLVRPNGG